MPEKGTGHAVILGSLETLITSFQMLDVSLADVSLPADL